MTAEFCSHDSIRHRLQYDLRPDFASNCTKKPSDYDLYSLFILFMIFQGFRLSFWCEIQLKNAQSWDLKFPRSPAVKQWLSSRALYITVPKAKFIPATIIAEEVTLKKSVAHDGRNCQVSVNFNPGFVWKKVYFNYNNCVKCLRNSEWEWVIK